MARITRVLSLFFVFIFCLGEGKLANPQLVAGKATVENKGGNRWDIHSGNKTIIHWDEFSLSAQEAAHFFQASKDSAVLNRVVGSLPSSIHGLIQSNGKVLLINEKGILIGKEGRIDTAGFVASTLDTSNDQFLKNESLLFKGASKEAVKNYGNIQCLSGTVSLIGLEVENHGAISAEGGHIALAAGSEVLLLPESEQHLIIRVERDELGGKVVQEGGLSALQVELAAAGTPYSLAIHSNGVIQAQGVKKENGRVFLTAHEGDCYESGDITAREGKVHVLGDRVALLESASLDVSGPVHGGEVLVGGDYKGLNIAIKNAEQTHMQRGAKIDAHGENGGKIVVWSEEYTTCHGILDASGDKGFVEVSGRGLDFQADVNLTSPNGLDGELLLDPKFINIVAAGVDPIAGNSLFTDIPSGTANISGLTLRNALNSANVTLQANTDITFGDTVTVTNNTQRTLTLQAGRSIIVQPGFDIDVRRCNFIATINDAGAIPADRDGGLAQFSLGAGSIIDTNRGGTNDGDISVTHGNFNGISEGIIFLDTGSFLDFGSGVCTLNGTASPSGGTGQRGVEIHGRVFARNLGTINITGVGAGGGVGEGDNVGVLIGTGGRIQANGSSTVTINGTGGTGDLGGNDGIRVDDGWLDRNGTGFITLTGLSNATSGNDNRGVSFVNAADLDTANGPFNVTGTGGDGVNGNVGIFFDTTTTFNGTGSGTLTLIGTGQGSGDNNVGVQINATTSLTANTGDIDITGGGAVSLGSGNDGIIVDGAITSTNGGAAAATITLNGTANGGNSHAGIRSSSGSGAITANAGDIDLTGTVIATSDANSAGVNLQNFTLTSTGSGANFANITLDGTGAPGANLSKGVLLNGTSVTSDDGAISMTGTAQDTSAVPIGAELSGTTIGITGLGAMSLTANGGDFRVGQTSDIDTTSGVFTLLAAENVTFASAPPSTITTTSGTVSITATNGEISLGDSGTVATSNMNATLNANTSVDLGSVDVGTAQITINAQTITNALSSGTNLTAGIAVLNTSGPIGLSPATGAGAIQTDLGTLQVAITGAGDCVIFENDALVLGSTSLNNGNLEVNAGGAITQGGGTIAVVGDALFQTSRDISIGTASITNNQATTVGSSVVAGDYILTTSPPSAISLSGPVDVGQNFTMVGTTFDRNDQALQVAGTTTLNGLDPFQNNTNEVFPSGGGGSFNLSSVTFAATGDITVNLRETQYTAASPVPANAVVLSNAGNSISGTLQVITVDPNVSVSALVDYDLAQVSAFTLNPGQNFTINAARGVNNLPIGGNNSPWGGSTLNGGNGSNINLMQSNLIGGSVSIRDPNHATLVQSNTVSLAHTNTYGDLKVTSSGGNVVVGALSGETTRSAGAANTLKASGDVILNEDLWAVDTSGVPFGTVELVAQTGSISSSAQTLAAGGAFEASSGTIGAFLQPFALTVSQGVYQSGGDCYLSPMSSMTVAGTSNGGNTVIQTVSPGNITVGSVTVGSLSEVGMTNLGGSISLTTTAGSMQLDASVSAPGQAISCLATGGAIGQSVGAITTQSAGTINLTADLGVTGYGSESALHISAQTVNAMNLTSGLLNIENDSTNSATVTLNNGAGGVDMGYSTYFSQVGDSSVVFNQLSGDGTAALLALSGNANMTFEGDVTYGGDFIAATQNTLKAEVVTFDLQGVATLIVDQQNPSSVGGGEFINQGTFNVATGNLAIYAASGPEAPASSPIDPPVLVQLGSLSALATWDQNEPNGLGTKYSTSYSTTFGTDFTPGNGVFGSEVIWYKESLIPPEILSPQGEINRSALRVIGINSFVSPNYYLETWDEETRRLVDYICQKNKNHLPCTPE